jgi:hypothetical protein
MSHILSTLPALSFKGLVAIQSLGILTRNPPCTSLPAYTVFLEWKQKVLKNAKTNAKQKTMLNDDNGNTVALNNSKVENEIDDTTGHGSERSCTAARRSAL